MPPFKAKRVQRARSLPSIALITDEKTQKDGKRGLKTTAWPWVVSIELSGASDVGAADDGFLADGWKRKRKSEKDRRRSLILRKQFKVPHQFRKHYSEHYLYILRSYSDKHGMAAMARSAIVSLALHVSLRSSHGGPCNGLSAHRAGLAALQPGAHARTVEAVVDVNELDDGARSWTVA